MRLHEKKKYMAIYILFVSVIISFFNPYATASENIYPTDGWQISTPEKQGMQSKKLVEMMEWIKKHKFDIDSISIVRNGYLVLDAYFYPYQKSQKHILAACTKSIISALIGIAIDKGYIQNVDQPIIDFFPAKTIANLDDLKKSITLEDLLMMASGLKCRDTHLYRWVGFLDMWNSNDWSQYVLDLPMAEVPGEKFKYPSGSKKKEIRYPGQIMRMGAPGGILFSAHIVDIPAGVKLEDFGPKIYAKELEDFGSNIKVASNKEMTLKCGTRAYQTDIAWLGKGYVPLTTYLISTYKNGKCIYLWAEAWIYHDKLEPIVQSLIFE
jgi:hypothetical protein